MKNLIITVSLAFFLFGLVPHAEALSSGDKLAPRSFGSQKIFTPRRFQHRRSFGMKRKFHSQKTFYKSVLGGRRLNSLNIRRGPRAQIARKFTHRKFELPNFSDRIRKGQLRQRLASKLQNRIR